MEISSTKNLERKKKEQIQGRTNRRRPISNPTIQHVIVNLYTKFEVSNFNACGDIFDKNLERKKKEQIQGRTNRRMPICNPTIQLVVVNLDTKYEVSILNGCGDIFDEKVLRKDGRTEGRTEPRTDVNQYTPHFFKAGVKKTVPTH